MNHVGMEEGVKAFWAENTSAKALRLGVGWRVAAGVAWWSEQEVQEGGQVKVVRA